ncbi:MAG: TPM domain-containing protein, partial [Pseudomonadota bacterium]|nr:TPM domain-containing protein [Pseudomonadota bacterium]
MFPRHVAPAAAALWLLALVVLAGTCQAAPQFPALIGPVVDAAGIIGDDAQARLERELRALQQASGPQLVVATVPNLQGYEIRDFGNQLFRHWRLGDRNRNDGALLLVAVEDRKMSIEVGYGLEAILTDAISKIIIEYSITPPFREGDFAGGIAAGVRQIERVLRGEGQTMVAEAPRADAVDWEEIIPALFLLFVVLVILGLILSGRGILLTNGG